MTKKSQQRGRSSKKNTSVQKIAQADLPTRYGRFTIYGFKGRGPQEEAVALVRGKLNGKTAPLVRVHSQCLTGDVLASLRCDCRANRAFRKSLAGISKPKNAKWGISSKESSARNFMEHGATNRPPAPAER